MRKKLRSKQGIAMIFAIAGFTVVMVIGVVFLTAGYANYSKMFGRKNDRQDYYTLVSAAKYAGSQLDGSTIRITETYEDKNDDGKYLETSDTDMNEKIGEVVENGAKAGTAEKEAEWVRNVLTCVESGKDVTYDLTFTDDDADYSAIVKVKVEAITLPRVDGVYQPTTSRIVLYTADEDGKVLNSVAVSLEISPAYGDAESKAINQMTKTTTYTIRMGNIVTENEGSST